MTPDISVIIPTRDRQETLLRTLGALGRQTVSPALFEVIVVADGCRDDTASRIRSLEYPFPLRFVEQSHSGAAAARNRGVALASAPILLFLDNDMEASPGLLRAHLAAHRRHPGDVALGYFRFPRTNGDSDIVVSHVDIWWGDRFSSMSSESHRFSFQDFFSGNVSLSRELFLQSGQFDERFQGRAGEDYELAARLLKRGARFRFIPEAACIHHDRPTARRMAERAYAEGRGHVLISSIHPETFPALPLREAGDGGPWVRIGPGLRLRPWALKRISNGFSLPIEAIRRLKARRILRLLLGFVRRCNYWRGVLDELGSPRELQNFTQDMPLKPGGVRELELDLRTEVARLGTVLERNPAGAARLWYGDRPVGYVPPLPVSERLRTEHILHAIIHLHGTDFLSAHIGGIHPEQGHPDPRCPDRTVGKDHPWPIPHPHSNEPAGDQ